MHFKKINSLSEARILLTNDDGIDAEGLKILEKEIQKICKNVWVVAPLNQKSGAAHSISVEIFHMKNNISPGYLPEFITKIDERHFAVAGSPADCVNAACKILCQEQYFDLVLSGINFGRNTSEDITYSGTIGAAMEALVNGIPAIAFSQHLDKEQRTNWEIARKYVAPMTEIFAGQEWPANTFISINFPNGGLNALQGVEATRGGEKRFLENPGNYKMARAENLRGKYEEHPIKNDSVMIENGYISVTPLSIDLTDYKSLDKVNSLVHQLK